MPSKKNKVSSFKIVTSKKPTKTSKPNTKQTAVKKHPAKPVKEAKPVLKKKLELKKVAKPAASAAKKVVAPKKAITKKLHKPTAKRVLITNAKKVEKTKAAIKKIVAKPKSAAQKPAEVIETKKTQPKQNSVEVKMDGKAHPSLNGVVVKSTEKKLADDDRTKKPTDPFAKKNYSDRTISDVLAISNTIPIKQKNEISASKIASISNSITNPVKKTDSYAVKPEKEPNGKFELEFVIHASAEMLYEFLSTPSGLSEWFCDDLNIRNGIYTFIWDDQLQQARLLKTVDVHLVRFQWVDKTDGSYFEFRIQRDDLTNDIALIITDFADSISERESSKLLWHSQIEKLMHVIGSIF